MKKYNVTVNKVEQEDSTHTPGIVINQSREKGSRIVSGTSITVTVAKKPESSSDEGEGDVADEETCEESGLC